MKPNYGFAKRQRELEKKRKKEEKAQKKGSAPESETQADASPAPAPAQQAPARNVGKVLQSQNGGGYTYAEVQTAAGQKVWIAGSQIDVKPGAEVQWGNFSVMRNFEAKSLPVVLDT